MKIFRIENQDTFHGMWYRFDGTYDPFIKTLTEGISKDLPMDFHERYAKDGLKWFSGCGDRDQMQSWFSSLDALELYQNDYRLYEFESSQFVIEENQILFTREGILSQKEIPLSLMWDLDNVKSPSITLR